LERARLEQEMRLARTIQQTLLPRQMPSLPGWQVQAHYEPAQAVGGDFYDFLTLEDGRVGFVIGDVSGKGMPAALVMATTRSLVRSAAQRLRSPGLVLKQVNDLLDQEIPPKMFVTCLYAVLDPATGKIRLANAGHNLPYRSFPGNGLVGELRATGMPLGIMSGVTYEETEAVITPGECVLFHSDGLVEAHDARRRMFGNPRLKELLAGCAGECPSLIDFLLAELRAFAGKNWQQEDDVTLVTLQRALQEQPAGDRLPAVERQVAEEAGWQVLGRFTLPSVPGADREARQWAIGLLEQRVPGLSRQKLEKLRTAVGEATMNAVEHGNQSDPGLPVEISVLASATSVAVCITDLGGGQAIHEAQAPDLEAKLAGRQSPRGWGLFLMRHMVDDVRQLQDGSRHTVELIVMLNGAPHDDQPA
jgi:anti-sigma regulatory factor (Ser/Thr protein kinase)